MYGIKTLPEVLKELCWKTNKSEVEMVFDVDVDGERKKWSFVYQYVKPFEAPIKWEERAGENSESV